MQELFDSTLFDTVAVAAVVIAVLVFLRWHKANRDGWTMQRPLPKVTFGLLGLVVAVTGFFSWQHQHLEDRLSKAASALAGFRVKVHCQDLAGQALDLTNDLGSVQFNADGTAQNST